MTIRINSNDNIVGNSNTNHSVAQKKNGKHFLRICLAFPKSWALC
jgi:hypothetical protein